MACPELPSSFTPGSLVKPPPGRTMFTMKLPRLPKPVQSYDQPSPHSFADELTVNAGSDAMPLPVWLRSGTSCGLVVVGGMGGGRTANVDVVAADALEVVVAWAVVLRAAALVVGATVLVGMTLLATVRLAWPPTSPAIRPPTKASTAAAPITMSAPLTNLRTTPPSPSVANRRWP